jgi:copper chaperone
VKKLPEEVSDMEKATFRIPNISCSHCIMTIERELKETKGVSKVEGDPDKKEITVEWDIPASLARIQAVLKEINYPAIEKE